MLQSEGKKMNIDRRIVSLVRDLNKAGFSTWSSCQGKTQLQNFYKETHCDHSFISFDKALNTKMKARIKKCGLYVYNGDVSVSALSGRETREGTVVERNLMFETKMRKAFRI